MLASWLDLILGFVVWWVGFHFFARARRRRQLRKKSQARDIAALLVMWLSAALITAGLAIVLGSMSLTWVVR